MSLKPQDVLIALDMARSHGTTVTYAERAKRLKMSASEVHAGVQRLQESRLLDSQTKAVRRKPFFDFLVHGVPYVFAVAPKEPCRGYPTAWAAPVFQKRVISNQQLPPVWPDPNGKVQGQAVSPLYRSVPKAIEKDPELYELLSLVDALRIGRARERRIASEELDQRLKGYAAD